MTPEAPLQADVETEAQRADMNKRQYLGRLQEAFQRMYRKAHLELGAASGKEMQDIKQGERFIQWEDERSLQGLLDFYETFPDEANRMHQAFIDSLLSLYNRKPRAISTEAIRQWDQWFRDPTVDFKKSKERVIKRDMPGFIAECVRAADERNAILQEAKKKGVDLAAVDGLSDFLNEDKFLAADAGTKGTTMRDRMIAKARSYLLAANKQMEPLWKDTQKYLVSLTVGEGQCLHRSKVGTWLKRIFDKANNPAQVERFLDEVLQPMIANWKEAATKYDVLHATGFPPSFKAVSKEKFLRWHYDERMTYLDELALSKDAMKEAREADLGALARNKMAIRFDLSEEDYDEAEDKLLPLLEQFPQDPDLRSMERYLKAHRSEKTEEEDDRTDPETKKAEILGTLRQLTQRIDPAMRKWDEEAMTHGPAVFRRWRQVNGNHEWVRTHGYSDAQNEAEHATSETNKRTTEQYMNHGHSRQLERNVIDGKTTHEEAIRDNCTKAQMLYVKSENCKPVLEKVRENKDNEMFGYWTTLVYTDVSYEKHVEGMNIQRQIQRLLQQLDDLGGHYTPEQALAGAKKAADTSHAMAA